MFSIKESNKTLKIKLKKDFQFRYRVDWNIIKSKSEQYGIISLRAENLIQYHHMLQTKILLLLQILKGTTCKILNVQEGRRERRNERSDHFLHSFVETVLESFWITWYMQIRFDLLTYFKTKIPTCYLALNFHLSPS